MSPKAARSMAAPNAPPFSGTRDTRPSWYARSASIGSPVIAISRAIWEGMRWGRRSKPPPAAKRPTLASGRPSRAPWAATIRSQARASSRPPANAYPSTAAMSGLAGLPLRSSSRAPWAVRTS